MRNNLTKKQVSQVPTLELAMRFNRLILMGETMPAGVITMAAARETLWIEDELRRRLLAAIGHDFYPPDGVAKPTMADMKTRMKSTPMPMPIYHTTQVIYPCSAGVTKKAEAEKIPKPVAAPMPKPAIKPAAPAVETEGNCTFNITIISSIGTTAAKKTVKVDTKGDAMVVAEKMIKTLGLKKAKYKIT